MRKTALLLIALVVITGCAGGFNLFGKNTDEQTILTTEYRKGSQGLVMKFIDKSPKDIVPENGGTVIGINLENKGAADISDGVLIISVDPEYMELGKIIDSTMEQKPEIKDNKITFKMIGASVYNPEGTQGNILISAKTKGLQPMSQSHGVDINAKTCYKYNTIATQVVCVDSDSYDIRKRTKSCTTKPIDMSDQRAPIAVKKIETNPVSKEDKIVTEFLITINNVGGGNVISQDGIDTACGTGELEEDFINNINVKVYLSSESNLLICKQVNEKKKNMFFLEDKKLLVSCLLEHTDQTSFTESPLIVELYYGYTQTISKSILITKS
ncbi:MAG: hypothetical protein ABIC04_05610 [Nanoarchaeota archaeon]